MDMETELEIFQKAANYVKATANNLDASINEGVCNTPKPGFFDFQGKQKWQAWKDLGTKSKEDCILEYVNKVSNIDPEWEVKMSEGKVKSKSGMGVAVSRMTCDEEDVPDDKKTLLDWVKEEDVERVCEMLGKDREVVNHTDEEGMSALHWACDRGSVIMVQTLLKQGAEINKKDLEGQTPLHYATSCEHVEVVRALLKNNADCTLCDNNGDLPETESEEIKALLQQNS